MVKEEIKFDIILKMIEKTKIKDKLCKILGYVWLVRNVFIFLKFISYNSYCFNRFN